MFWRRASWLAASLLLSTQRAHAEDVEGASSLLSDTARVVAAEEVDDWFADKEAMRSIELHLMPSLCQASPEARASALFTLQKRHAELGDAKTVFAAQGESTAMKDALTAERRLTALERVLARQTECPFWVTPAPGFDGLQSDRKRITISAESGGVVQFRHEKKHVTFGAGGSGRLLVGWGFDGRYTLLAGPEFGGSALLRPGSNASEFVINYFPAFPVVFRTRGLTWHYDVEVAPVSLFEADNTRLSLGARIGGAFAFTALRRRNVLAWAGLAVAYEYYFDSGGRGPIHFFRGGLRIGLPWDP